MTLTFDTIIENLRLAQMRELISANTVFDIISVSGQLYNLEGLTVASASYQHTKQWYVCLVSCVIRRDQQVHQLVFTHKVEVCVSGQLGNLEGLTVASASIQHTMQYTVCLVSLLFRRECLFDQLVFTHTIVFDMFLKILGISSRIMAHKYQ